MDRLLRVAAIAAVVGMGIPPMLELGVIGHPNQRAAAATILVLAAIVGVYSAFRRWPLPARFTTIAYGTFGVGLGLFATDRPLHLLLAYVVGLLGMNLLLYHVFSYGPVLAAFRREGPLARRTRAVVLRSLAFSGGALALAYGGSLALLPLFALDIGPRDAVSALLLTLALLFVLLLLSLLPEGPPSVRRLFARLR